MKRTIIALIAGIMILSLAGCQSQTGSTVESAETKIENDAEDIAESASENGDDSESAMVDVYNWAISVDVSNFSPFYSGGNAVTKGCIYETLCNYDEEMNLYGVLAESWEKVADDTMRVTLNENIVDHWGNKMTASDVKFSLDKHYEAVNDYIYDYISSEVVSEYVVDVTFSHEIYLGTFEDVATHAWIVTEAAWEQSGDDMQVNACGTAHYMVTDYTSGYMWQYTLQDDYWNEGNTTVYEEVHAKVINCYVIAESSQRVIALQDGTIDGVQNISGSDIVYFEEGGESSEGFNAYKNKITSLFSLVFNCSDDVATSDPRVRQAICYLLDLPAISAAVYDEGAEYPKAWGDDLWAGYNPEWAEDDYYSYNVEKATELLKEAGYLDGKDLDLYFIGVGEPVRASVMTIVEAALNSVDGINCVCDNNLTSDEIAKIKANGDGWNGYLTFYMSGGYLQNYWAMHFDTSSTTHGGTVGYVFDDKLQSMLAEVRTEEGYTEEKMDELYDYIVNEQCYCYGLAFGYDYVALKDNVKPVWTWEKKQAVWATQFSAED